MGRERLEIEFGRYAGWLAEAVTATTRDDPIPAACRGTGNPKLLREVADALGLAEGTVVLDVGCGIGGPGAWMKEHTGCGVVGVDVMHDAARGARLLFPGMKVVVASSRALPFQDGAFDAAFALGVLETIADKPSALREIARVLTGGARFCAYTYLCSEEGVSESPVADRFEERTTFERNLEEVGLTCIDARRVDGLDAIPPSWREAALAAHEEVERRHGDDPRFGAAIAEMDKVARLIADRIVQPWLYVLKAA
jgi:SAM-dependent methyltransferase